MKKLLFILILLFSSAVHSAVFDNTLEASLAACNNYISSYSGSYCRTDYIHWADECNTPYVGYKQFVQLAYVGQDVPIVPFYTSCNACPQGTTFNDQTGTCDVPVDCSDTSTPGWFDSTLPGTICSDGCTWSSGGGVTIIRAGLTIPYYRTGAEETCTINATEGVEDTSYACDGEVCPHPTNPDCVLYKGVEICPDITNENCITNADGKEICATDTKNCWRENGVIFCSSTSSEVPDNCIRNEAGDELCIDDTVETSETESETTTQVDPDTTSTTTTTDTTNNIDGDTNTSTTTTTTTYTDPVTGDTITGTDEETTGEDTASASGGDDCTSAPYCAGDVIACALLEQQWLLRCQSETVQIDETELISDMTGGITEADLIDSPFDFANAVSDSYFTINNGSDSCPADLPVTIMGSSHSFSYTPLCDTAIAINPFIIFAGLISSIFILFRETS